MAKKKIWNLQEGHVVVPAFVSGGVQYYKLNDLFNTFCLRALEALDLYDQIGMRTDREYLIAHTKKTDEILSGKSINIGDFAQMNNNLKERLNFIIPPQELIYRLAAVAYFDESESPYKYDEKYGREKIERWKKADDIEDFFLSRHIRDLLPFPDISEDILKNSLRIQQKIDEIHRSHLSSPKSSQTQKNGSQWASL